MTRAVFTILAAGLFCSVTQVQAGPISYSLTTTASGTLGGKSFTNALVTVTLTGDTANVAPGPAPFADVLVNPGSATVSVSGFATATFTDSIVIVSTLNDTAVLGGEGPAALILDNTTGTGILLQDGSIFSSYDLRGPLGPLSGTGGVASGSHVTPVFPTTAGNLTWAIGQPLGPSTFTAVATPKPSINPGGIVPIDSSSNTIQPGEWVSIYGANLASGAATWSGNYPLSLGNTSVTINGKPAYLSFVSPGQINLQAPDDTTIGTVSVVVTTANGSATSTVTLGPLSPSFLLFDSKHVAGIIARTDGSFALLGPTGNSLGFPTVAAKAGDWVELFGVGFGPTSPAVPAGQAFSGAAQTTGTVNVLINNVGIVPAWAGLSAAGLYQINLQLPAGLGAGDVTLAASVNGVQTESNVVISMQ